MTSFDTWYNKRLVVGPFPNESQASKLDIVINVSDEHNHNIAEKCKTYYWFPMNEFGNDIGLNSIFGALQILYYAETSNKSVLLHCHAGVNRSVTVSQLYKYMRTCSHVVAPHARIEDWQIKMFQLKTDQQKSEFTKSINTTVLERNIEGGHLPEREKLESFVTLLNEALQSNKSISLDELLINSKINEL